MACEESDPNNECKLVAILRSTKPVVGCEIKPEVRLKWKGIATDRQLPPHSLTFSWYREMACHVHPSQVATVQCTTCIELQIPVTQSCFCSSTCYLNAWKMHEQLHCDAVKQTTTGDQPALKRLKSCGSWTDFSSDQLVTQFEWKMGIKVGDCSSYEPSKDDVGFLLRLECMAVDNAKGNLLGSVNITTDAVINFPTRPPRKMIKFGSYEKSFNASITHHFSDGLTFSVLSYNILADIYVDRKKYNYCPNWALVLEYRRQNLLHEIIEYNADILCLQEVQSDYFEGILKPQLIKCGYSAVFKKKRTTMFSSFFSESVSEGCATFYRQDLFKEIKKYEIEFEQRALLAIEGLRPELRNMGKGRLPKDNVALIVILEAIRNGSTNDDFQYRLCVANTHVCSNREFPDVKLYQVAELINGLEKIAQSKIPILICGDFNSDPGSDPHTLLVRGRIDSVHGNKTDPLGIYRILKLEHSLALDSAYESFFHLNKEKHLQKPLFTICTPKFRGTLDYVLYTVDSLSVEDLSEHPDSASLRADLPSDLWSSDHVALMASFRLKPPSTTESSPPLPQEI